MSKDKNDLKQSTFYTETINLENIPSIITIEEQVRADVTEKAYLNYADFDPNSAQNVGGVSGGQAIKYGRLEDGEPDDRRRYQVKNSETKAPTTLRNILKNSDDVVNFGEFIASRVSRAIVGTQDAELIPKVYLVHKDSKDPEILVASRYLNNTVGTIDQYAKSWEKVAFSSKHVKVTANSSSEKKLSLENKALLRSDLAKAIALSALSGDHDINPGNMMVVLDKNLDKTRIARIDFGHAFNELLNHISMGGGRVKNKENRILDFFNRELVSGCETIKSTGVGGASKLWKNYEGLIPSQEFADALKEISDSKNIEEGLNAAKSNFIALVADLSENNEKNKELIGHITKSLVGINNSESMGVEKINETIFNTTSPQEIISKVFDNLSIFYQENQKQMADVAKLMQAQVNIDQIINDAKDNKLPNSELINAIKSQYKDLELAQGIGIGVNTTGDAKINWIKSDASIEALTGTLDEYIKTRSQKLGLDKTQATNLATIVTTGNLQTQEQFTNIVSGLDIEKLFKHVRHNNTSSTNSNSTSPSSLERSVISYENPVDEARKMRDSIMNTVVDDTIHTRNRSNAIGNKGRPKSQSK
jgi:hypothetical protein